MSNRLVTEGMNALREAYNTLTTYTGQPRPYPKWGGDHATYMSSKDGKFNYVSSKDFKGADLQTPKGRIYYDNKSITTPGGQKITGTGRGIGTAETRRRALGEQGSLLDFVNSVAPAGGRKTRSQGSLSNFVNRVAPAGGSSASSGTSTGLKEPRTLKNYATNNHLGGYTSKDKRFNSADIGPGRYYATDSRDNEYDSNSMTIRGFGRGVQSRTFTGTGRSNVR